MNYPAASRGVSSSVLARHSVLDTESSRALWIPASAGMTNSRQSAGYRPSTRMNQWRAVHRARAGARPAILETAVQINRCFGTADRADGAKYQDGARHGEPQPT